MPETEKFGKAQHGEHRGEADGGHRQQRARHQAVDQSLEKNHGSERATPGPHHGVMSGTGVARSQHGSSDLHQGRLAGLDLLVAELAVEDVALVVEVARAGRAGVVDLLAGGDRLQPVDRIVDRLAAALG